MRFTLKRFKKSLKKFDFFVAVAFFIVAFITQYHFDYLSWLIEMLHKFDSSHNTISTFIYSTFIFLLSYFGIDFIKFRHNTIKKYKSDLKIKREKIHTKNKNFRNHFEHSYHLVRKELIPQMEVLINNNNKEKNNLIDSYIRSPIEYVNEIAHGNQVPEFNPNDTFQNVLYDKSVNFIVAITAENPNMFLDPTIGFYMSNCYAASIIRKINDYLIKNTQYDSNYIPQLSSKKLSDLEERIDAHRQTIIKKLINKEKLEDFEFIRFFIYNEQQGESCENAVFPSLKASQDLFRTLSFYIQKEELKTHLNETWDELHYINEKLWHLFDKKVRNKLNAKKVLEDRIVDTIPEFLFVFYDNYIKIYTYLDGKPYSEKVTCKPGTKLSGNAANIYNLIRTLANYANETDDKGELSVRDNQINKENSFIDWEWVSKKIIDNNNQDNKCPNVSHVKDTNVLAETNTEVSPAVEPKVPDEKSTNKSPAGVT